MAAAFEHLLDLLDVVVLDVVALLAMAWLFKIFVSVLFSQCRCVYNLKKKKR